MPTYAEAIARILDTHGIFFGIAIFGQLLVAERCECAHCKKHTAMDLQELLFQAGYSPHFMLDCEWRG